MRRSIFGVRLLRIAVVMSAVALVLSSCSDEDAPIAPEAEHFEAIGLVIYSSGIEVASILRGVTDDTLIAPEGALSDHYEVRFYDDDENVIDAPEQTEDTYFDWTIDDPEVAEVWQHAGEERAFEFHLRGLEVGETQIEFFVKHIDHSDYRSGKFPLRVESVAGTHGEPIGVILEDEESGSELARAHLADSGTPSQGGFTLAGGETTDHIEATFFDDQDREFSPPAPPHSLLIESSNTSVVTITGLEEDEPWAFRLQGVAAGSATVTVKLLDDGNVGKVFTSIAVTVN